MPEGIVRTESTIAEGPWMTQPFFSRYVCAEQIVLASTAGTCQRDDAARAAAAQDVEGARILRCSQQSADDRSVLARVLSIGARSFALVVHDREDLACRQPVLRPGNALTFCMVTSDWKNCCGCATESLNNPFELCICSLRQLCCWFSWDVPSDAVCILSMYVY